MAALNEKAQLEQNQKEEAKQKQQEKNIMFLKKVMKENNYSVNPAVYGKDLANDIAYMQFNTGPLIIPIQLFKETLSDLLGWEVTTIDLPFIPQKEADEAYRRAKEQN